MPSIIVGLLAFSLGLWGASAWWWSVVELLRGTIPVLLMVFGVVSLAAGISTWRQNRPDVEDDSSILSDQDE